MIDATKILIYDIETSHMIAAVFDLYGDQGIPHSNILQDWTIYSAAWKWLGDKTIHSRSTADSTELEVLTDLVTAIDSADIVVAHNGDKFDMRKLRTRALMLGIKPFRIPASVDTLKVARRHFKFSSNRLDYLALTLGYEGKLANEPGLWLKALKGDKKALAAMEKYNKQDVKILEDVYLRLRPYIDNHPNVGIAGRRDLACPHCASTHVVKDGFYLTRAGKRQRLHCQGCGAKYKI